MRSSNHSKAFYPDSQGIIDRNVKVLTNVAHESVIRSIEKMSHQIEQLLENAHQNKMSSINEQQNEFITEPTRKQLDQYKQKLLEYEMKEKKYLNELQNQKMIIQQLNKQNYNLLHRQNERDLNLEQLKTENMILRNNISQTNTKLIRSKRRVQMNKDINSSKDRKLNLLQLQNNEHIKNINALKAENVRLEEKVQQQSVIVNELKENENIFASESELSVIKKAKMERECADLWQISKTNNYHRQRREVFVFLIVYHLVIGLLTLWIYRKNRKECEYVMDYHQKTTRKAEQAKISEAKMKNILRPSIIQTI